MFDQPTPDQTATAESELRIALEQSVKLQTHYASLLNMHDGGERIGFESADAWIARLRETGTLPPARAAEDRPLRERIDATFEEFAQAHPDRAKRMAAEINEIARGNFRSIEFDLDPLNAQRLAGAIDLALSHPDFPPSTRETLETLYRGIAERVGAQFPELGQQLADGRRQRMGEAAPRG